MKTLLTLLLFSVLPVFGQIELSLLGRRSAAGGLTVRSTSYAAGTATDATPSEPTGAAENDILVAIMGCASAGTIGIPSGWTSIEAGTDAFDGFFDYSIAWIRRGASAPSLTWTTGSSVYREVQVVCISGAITSGSPIEANTGAQGSATQPDGPSVTTLTANAMVLTGFYYGQNGGSSAGGWTVPASYTLSADNTANNRTCAAVRVMPSTGAENPAAWANSTAVYNWRAWSLSIKPQ